MKATDVPSLQGVGNAFGLRSEVVKALSTAQVQGRVSPTSKTADTLAAFFRACADLAEGFRPAAPPDPAPPKPKTPAKVKGSAE